jgi:hypothetical protein
MTRCNQPLALAVVLAMGCGANAVEPAVPGAAEVVLSESAPPAGYVQLQQLSVQSGKGCGFAGVAGSRENADAKLRAEAAKISATFVQVTGVLAPRPNHQCLEHEYKLSGVAYRKVIATPTSARVAAAPKASAPAAPSAIVQDYEPGAPASTPSAPSAVSRLSITLAAGDPNGNALSVDYGCSGTEQRALLDVWSEPRTADWSKASALTLRVKPDAAISLSVSFMDGNHAGYTQQTPTLVAGSWQTVSLPFDKFWLNPFGPQGDTPGQPQDRSQVAAFGFAPHGCTNGHFLIDDFALSN